MTDATKWKSVMLRVNTYEQLKEIAARDKRPIAGILNDLVEKEWRWHFEDKRQPEPNQISKDPERRISAQGPRNPFLMRKPDSGVDR